MKLRIRVSTPYVIDRTHIFPNNNYESLKLRIVLEIQLGTNYTVIVDCDPLFIKNLLSYYE